MDPLVASAIVTAVATVALAAVGAISIIANFRLIRATRAQVSEIQRDRELAHRPFLTFEWDAHNPLADPDTRAGLVELSRFAVIVANIGKGPALECQYFGWFTSDEDDPAKRVTATYVSERFPVGTDHVEPARAMARPLDSAKACAAIADLVEASKDEPVEALVCIDQFNKVYRFVRGQPLPKIWPDDYPTRSRPVWVDGVGKVNPPAPVAPPSSNFQALLAQNLPDTAIGVVAEAVPHSDSTLGPSMRSVFLDWVMSIQPESEGEVFGPTGITFFVQPRPRTRARPWYVECHSGPVVKVWQPARVDIGVLSVVDSAQSWARMVEELSILINEMGVESVYIGLFLSVNANQRPLNGLEFAPVVTPVRYGKQPREHWREYIKSPVPVADLTPAIALRLIPSLFEDYGYLDIADAIAHLKDNVFQGG